MDKKEERTAWIGMGLTTEEIGILTQLRV